jgi:hypothetical protein
VKSKPIDPWCPVQAVAFEEFSRIFRSFAEGDRYFHIAHYKNRAWHALWDWNRGVFVMNDALNKLIPVAMSAIMELEASYH